MVQHAHEEELLLVSSEDLGFVESEVLENPKELLASKTRDNDQTMCDQTQKRSKIVKLI